MSDRSGMGSSGSSSDTASSLLVHCLCWSQVGKVICTVILTDAIIQTEVIPASRTMCTQTYSLSHLSATLSMTEVSNISYFKTFCNITCIRQSALYRLQF